MIDNLDELIEKLQVLTQPITTNDTELIDECEHADDGLSYCMPDDKKYCRCKKCGEFYR